MEFKNEDQAYLLSKQYKDASNLNARINLHTRFSVGETGQSFHRWVFDHLQLTPGAKVLELGSGPGMLWQENIDRISPEGHVTLSDFSGGMLQEAQAALAGKGNFEFRQIDAQFIPFEDASFDRVIANHMLYHVPDRPKALGEIARVLKPGGQFFTATNGKSHMLELYELQKRLFPEWPDNPFSQTFSLENAAEQLSPYFKSIRLELFPSDLKVTEAQAIVDYVNSYALLNEQQLGEIRVIIQKEIDNKGFFFIGKSTGLFICEL
jgi:ubiquinone/menaquinone biosynthesis C-methylase UbiE